MTGEIVCMCVLRDSIDSTYCNTLQHTATHCSKSTENECVCASYLTVSIHCNTLQHTTTHCNTLQKINEKCACVRRTWQCEFHPRIYPQPSHTLKYLPDCLWMSHVTRSDVLCHTYEWVLSNIWMGHVVDSNKSCHTYEGEWVMSHVWVCRVHVGMSRVTRMNMIRRTYR